MMTDRRCSWWRRAVAAVGAILLMTTVTATVAAEDEAPTMDPQMAAMMEAWQAYRAIGEPQEALQRRVGEWDATVKFWYGPGADPQVSEGRSTVEAVMGGRYIRESFTSTMPDGSPFEGMGLVGYDNFKQRFVALWIDSMSSGFMTAESTSHSDDYSRIEYSGETPDPMAEGYKPQRSVESWKDADTRSLMAWEAGPEGEEFKVMEITYRRR